MKKVLIYQNSPLWAFCFFIFLSVAILVACRKTDQGPQQDIFDSAAAKEWFYGSFRKSAEYRSVNTTTAGQKLPNWETGRYKKLGNTEIVEFDLTEQKKTVVLKPSENRFSDDRIAEAAISRAVFVKSRNDITLKLVKYIPELNYLTASKYDISKNGLINPDERFTGKILFTNWNGNFVKGYNVENGKKRNVIKQIIKQAPRSAGDNGALNTSINPDCYYSYYAWLEQNCTITPLSDNIAIENCSNWELVWDYVVETSCPLDPNDCISMGLNTEDCMCQLFGSCTGESDEAIDCNAQIDDAFNGIQTENELQSKEWTSNLPDTRVIRYKWKFAKSNPTSIVQWYYNSIDDGYHKKINGEWRYDTIKHVTEQKNIGTSIFVNVELKNVQPHAYIGLYHASMELSYQIYLGLICKGSPISNEGSFTSSKIFSVSETP
jgi:hypothetical protein